MSLTRQATKTNAENSTAINNPGMKPAKYKSETDVSDRAPYSTMLMLGGIRMPSVPPAAMEPRNKAGR
ncbi:hypothetical protein D9M68_747420 [compost metagenome]